MQVNVVYSENEWRSFLTLNAISLVFTIGAIMFVLSAIVGIVVLPVALNYIGLSHSSDWLLRLGRWPAMLITVAFGLALVYRFGPSRKAPRWRWITWGSAIASLLWLLASVLFSFYAANLGSFNATYGSLGAAIGFMTWLWISAIVILLGAELDAELERQTGKDPTG